jgi:hypothetical protein
VLERDRAAPQHVQVSTHQSLQSHIISGLLLHLLLLLLLLQCTGLVALRLGGPACAGVCLLLLLSGPALAPPTPQRPTSASQGV